MTRKLGRSDAAASLDVYGQPKTSNRIATNALIPERYDALYYEVLKGLDLSNLPAHKQVAAILFSACTCNIINKIDCRQVVTEADFQEKLVQAQGLDDLYAQFFKLFDKLNSGGSKEKSKDEEQTNIGEALAELLSHHNVDDSRSNTQ